MDGKRKILVVEDNTVNRMTLRKILQQEYEVLEAENGLEALEVLERESQELSLIFLDIHMPVMDGYEFLERAQANPIYASVPVIVATQSDGDEDEVAALAHGATDFVTKPYKPSVIRHRAASIISLRETAAMMNQMEFDPLTGVYTQAFFYKRTRELLNQNPDKPFDLICSNVENFKFINEVFGLAVGDQMLCLVAQEMQSIFLHHGGVGGRLRADIFASIQPHWEDQEQLEREMSRVQERIRQESGVSNFSMRWGVYRITDTHLPVERMCDWALLACDSIRGQYGHLVAYYNDALRRAQLREKMLADSMEDALRQGQFLVYYQPKFNLRTNRIYGAEALVRWNHPTMGMLPPGEFAPLFERNGFITQMDQFVWNTAARNMGQWRQQGLPAVPVSVNVSRADIFNADLESILTDICRRNGIPRTLLHLEITETAYTEEHEQLCESVSKLRQAGFVIEMDDFGSGYSSLNMLNELPIDVLKLDMKFLRDDGQERIKRRSILSFVVSLARWLDLQVVAEGVETADQVQKLRNVGCGYAQGYYFSPPLPAEQFEQFLRDADVDEDQEENLLVEDELLEKTRLLEMAAFQDYLTGLLNRRGLNNALEKLGEIQEGAAIFIFDMDDLKRCNDSRGHSGGDGMLQHFAQVLRAQTRSGDILSRIGGDEFVMVIPRMPSADAARKKGVEICRAFQKYRPDPNDQPVSCSAGLAIVQAGECFDDAFARADQALYKAKRTKKGECVLCGWEGQCAEGEEVF